MELIEYKSLMQDLKQKRQSLNLTQKEVALKADISPAQLSRMENGNAEAKYSTVYRIWETLQYAESDQKETAADLCTSNIESVTTNDTGRDAKELMLKNSYSQLPVRDPESGRAVGSITERHLLEANDIECSLDELMRKPFIELRPETERSVVVELLQGDNDAVLVRDDNINKYLGIITRADII